MMRCEPWRPVGRGRPCTHFTSVAHFASLWSYRIRNAPFQDAAPHTNGSTLTTFDCFVAAIVANLRCGLWARWEARSQVRWGMTRETAPRRAIAVGDLPPQPTCHCTPTRLRASTTGTWPSLLSAGDAPSSSRCVGTRGKRHCVHSTTTTPTCTHARAVAFQINWPRLRRLYCRDEASELQRASVVLRDAPRHPPPALVAVFSFSDVEHTTGVAVFRQPPRSGTYNLAILESIVSLGCRSLSGLATSRPQGPACLSRRRHCEEIIIESW
jgi:hypothetical protein